MHNIRYTKLAESDLASLFQLIYADKPHSAIDLASITAPAVILFIGILD